MTETGWTQRISHRWIWLLVWGVLASISGASADTIVKWDFTAGVHGWAGNDRVEPLKSTPEGIVVKCTGPDPWIESGAMDFPGLDMTKIIVRMKSTADRSAEFFYGTSFRAGDEVSFNVQNDGKWHDYSVLIPENLGKGTRLRLDPCSDAGEIVIAYIEAQTVRKIAVPQLPMPSALKRNLSAQASAASGNVRFTHYGGRWGNFEVRVDDRPMAAGCDTEYVGISHDGEIEWTNLRDIAVKAEQLQNPRRVRTAAAFKDKQNVAWRITRTVEAARFDNTLTVTTSVSVSEDTELVSFPWLTLLAGFGTFGEHKDQAVFAGLEYLSDEPSGSDADIAKPNHIRRTPDGVKITFPLMAVVDDGRYIGLVWSRSDMVAATFDSPDRIYNSQSHLMALSAPAVGKLRFENDLTGHTPFELKAGAPLTVEAMIIAGKATSAVGAVRHYTEIRGLPDVPRYEGGFGAAGKLLAHGWLDSKINEGALFRHAVWGDSFGPVPAADAAMYMDWLARNVDDDAIAKRLIVERDKAIERLPGGDPFASGVSHVRHPNTPLVFGRVDEYVSMRRRQAIDQLSRFDADGLLQYRPGTVDYARTHFATHANGLSASTVASILEAAILSADKDLAAKATALLDKQTIAYKDTVPRGAQTWEVPLHTPDILASAYMIKAYVWGYVLTGREDLLDQAKYWAWTGVPFVYLDNPTDGRVGPYATIAVLGATNWQAPVWFGRPVQWCGLVYCSALHDLAPYDPQGPWDKIAKGITATGLQMSWPVSDDKRQGLLPDFYFLVEQISDGPAINPGTVEAHLPELFGKGRMYDLKRLPKRGWFLIAPCQITSVEETAESVSFGVDGWGDRQFYVIVSGMDKSTRQFTATDSDRKTVSVEAQYINDLPCTILKLKGKCTVTIR